VGEDIGLTVKLDIPLKHRTPGIDTLREGLYDVRYVLGRSETYGGKGFPGQPVLAIGKSLSVGNGMLPPHQVDHLHQVALRPQPGKVTRSGGDKAYEVATHSP
jgi:hypothetical protein